MTNPFRTLVRRISGAASYDRILTELRELRTEQKQLRADQRIARRQLTALVRREAVVRTEVGDSLWLHAQRFRLRSQNDEDGITLALLKLAGVTNRKFVEIGAGSSGGNSAILAFEYGWSGLMVEWSRGKADALRRQIAPNRNVTVLQKRVTPDNLNELLRQNRCEGDIDFMSIDVDSTDYWLLDALHVCSPRILVMEYNAHFGPTRAVTLPTHGLPERVPHGYFGASLSAIEKKARDKGYRLILCEDAGVNAFFLRDDAAPELQGVPPELAFRPPTSRLAGDGASDIFGIAAEAGLPLIEV